MGLQTQTVKQTQLSGEITLANNIAASKMETWKLTSFAGIVNEAVYYDKNGQNVPLLINAYFTARTRVTSSSNFKEVVVVVSWRYDDKDPGVGRAITIKGRFFDRS